MTKLRCAIYTRKSSDEGLEQSFNSLDAQREACSAYITSQKSEGWTLIPTHYDDGGWSGGTMERPALQQLLGDIALGKIDVVVVYKVDRLTRSLPDFARIVEAFDAKGVSFVSVTQAFNTTTSMGRLTLNVLLSFAQFEREVTGERIRDKIAASKARGMWMGGMPPYGYDPKDRSLVINEEEAPIVRHIFSRYLELGSVHILMRELEAQGVRTRIRTNPAGKTMGGIPFGHGPLYTMLRNHIYRERLTTRERFIPACMTPSSMRNCSTRCRACWTPTSAERDDARSSRTMVPRRSWGCCMTIAATGSHPSMAGAGAAGSTDTISSPACRRDGSPNTLHRYAACLHL